MTKATIVLRDGRKMNFELCPEAAPITVENFVALAEKGFYDGLCFHRVIEGFMIQGGGFVHGKSELVPKKAANTIRGEFEANGVHNPIKHVPGVISMARTAVPDSASSQFFICVAPTPHLDGQYAAFGRAADRETVEVAVNISRVETAYLGYFADVPVSPVVIDSVRITRD